MALKDKIFETVVLGGVTLLAQKGIGHMWDRLVPPAPPPAPPPPPEPYPAPPATSLGGYRVKVNADEAEGLTAAISRGVLTAFGVPTAAAPAAASFAAQASVSAPAEEPRPATRRTCCADCRAGKPCCGKADSHAHVGSVDEPDEGGEDDDFLSYALGGPVYDLEQVNAITKRVDEMRRDYEKQLESLRASGNKETKGYAAEIKRLQKTIEELIKAQSKAKRLPLMATPVPSKADKMTEIFEKYLATQEARAAVPQAAPAPAQPIIVTAPWGAPPAAPAAAPAAAPPPAAPNPYEMDLAAQDPFMNADLMAMLAVSGVDDVPPIGGVAAKLSPAAPAAPSMVNPFPSCGC